jgi:glutathione synthase/RimK-type ligase-like ATP-grasp enzyme
LRVIVAGGSVVGAVRRIAAAGEWRTNVALGARRLRTVPPPEACSLALAAAEVIGGDLVGIDLLPTADGYVVIEANGCVDLTTDYSLGRTNVFDEIARLLLAVADLELLEDAEAARRSPR